MPSEEKLHNDDPALAGGEWLFRRDGQVFGPIDSRALAAMLYRGEIDARTPVSSSSGDAGEDGSWRALGEVPIFVLHAKKAAAGLRVEREVTGARMLRARRNRRRAFAIGLVAVLLVAGAVAGALHLARRAREMSPLLEDFGAGIRIASAARVGVSRRADDDEFEVPLEDQSGPHGAPHRSRAGSAAGAAGGGDELVAALFDPKKIQAVVGREQRTLVPCFRAEAARSPDFQGDVPIEFAIGNDGRIAQVWIDEPRFREGPLRDCLLKTLAGWRFDSFPGQRPTVSLAFGMGR